MVGKSFYFLQFNIQVCETFSHKKSELMLMRRARAYGSSCSQVILVYLHPFRRITPLQPKIAKKIT